ncbi:MAG: hypothetical protein M3R59_00465 [Verrucomicrobiota bacterium]|nr:hypothetical protein [Verrucomicrobiota bacterium]
MEYVADWDNIPTGSRIPTVTAVAAVSQAAGAQNGSSYGEGGGLSMGRVSVESAPKIDQKIIRLGRAAVDKAKNDSECTVYHRPVGYNLYDVDGKIKWIHSNRAEWTGKRWIESYPKPPEDGKFLANGHIHPMDQHNRFAGSSFSPDDIRTGQSAPVFKNNSISNRNYDIYFKGFRWLVENGTNLSQPQSY